MSYIIVGGRGGISKLEAVYDIFNDINPKQILDTTEQRIGAYVEVDLANFSGATKKILWEIRYYSAGGGSVTLKDYENGYSFGSFSITTTDLTAQSMDITSKYNDFVNNYGRPPKFATYGAGDGANPFYIYASVLRVRLG